MSKKFFGFCCALTLLISCGRPQDDELSQPLYASGKFNGHGDSKISHSLLIEEAVELLQTDATLSLSQQAFVGMLRGRVAEIQLGGDRPDLDETFPVFFVPTFKGHFYHYRTKTNYLGQSSPTAMTEYLRHHALADAAMKDDDTATYLNELGRAMHYLADACVPHHATNRIAGLSWHSGYENFINDIHLNRPEDLRPSRFEKHDEASVGDLLDICATKAASVVELADASISIGFEGEIDPDYDAWMKAAKVHVPYTQEILAAYMRKSMLQFTP